MSERERVRRLVENDGAEGAAILDEARDFIGRFVVFPTKHALIAITLWAAHTHLVDRFDSTPRLAVLSPEKQSGKTRALEILELLCVGAERLSDTSAAFVFRRVAQGSVTVLLDECDAIWKRRNGDEAAEALRSVVNAGHRKGATVGRVEMDGKTGKLVRYPVYAPTALAGIGDLPDTILDRSVIIRMRRRAPDESITPYRERLAAPEGKDLRDRLAEWCESVADKIGSPWPDMPSGVEDRPADVWEPLLAVADLAGGHWPQDARSACVAFVTGSREETASVGVRLLTDLHDIYADRDEKGQPTGAYVDALWTEKILDQLHKLDESPWGDWYGRQLSSRDLAKLLKPYGVKPRDVRIEDVNRKGYRREDLWDAWRRYVPSLSATSATCATGLASAVAHVADVALTGRTPDDAGQTQMCEVCDKPLQAYYIKIGRDRHPGCPPVNGSERLERKP